MATKTKPKDTTQTWTVVIDGNTPVEVTAETFEITEGGMLVFGTDETIVKAVATGHWTEVDLKPPPVAAGPETPEA